MKIDGEKMRQYGFTQISVAIDFLEMFFFQRSGFLNRGEMKNDHWKTFRKYLFGNHKSILIKKYPIKMEKNDNRFMDSFDHVVTSLVNQAEEDKDAGIPFNLGPIKSRQETIKMRLGNNWYSDTI